MLLANAAMRLATEHDLPAVVRLLADDTLGATRERYADPLPKAYLDAFAATLAQLSQLVAAAPWPRFLLRLDPVVLRGAQARVLDASLTILGSKG